MSLVELKEDINTLSSIIVRDFGLNQNDCISLSDFIEDFIAPRLRDTFSDALNQGMTVGYLGLHEYPENPYAEED